MLEHSTETVTRIGSRLRELRTEAGRTLSVLADEVELSKGYLSQIESEKKTPHWSTLMRILHALGTTLCEFHSDREAAEGSSVVPGGPIIRLAGGVPDEWGRVEGGDSEGYTWILTPDPTRTLRCEVIRFRIPPHTAWTPEMIRFSGWGQAFTLEGKVLLEVGKSERDEFLVEEGETIGYEGRIPHRFRNYTDRPTEILLTISPPAL